MQAHDKELLMLSVKLARLIGPVLLVVTLSEFLNDEIWSHNTAIGIYQNGMLLFILGVGIIGSHNIWEFSWRTFITIVSCVLMLMGLIRMFFPLEVLNGPPHPSLILLTELTLFCIGVLLIFKGYFGKSQS